MVLAARLPGSFHGADGGPTLWRLGNRAGGGGGLLVKVCGDSVRWCFSKGTVCVFIEKEGCFAGLGAVFS